MYLCMEVEMECVARRIELEIKEGCIILFSFTIVVGIVVTSKVVNYENYLKSFVKAHIY